MNLVSPNPVDDALSFLRCIEEEPTCLGHRLVFGDWLEEHNLPKEAERQRMIALIIGRGKRVYIGKTNFPSVTKKEAQEIIDRDFVRQMIEDIMRMPSGKYDLWISPFETTTAPFMNDCRRMFSIRENMKHESLHS